MTEFEKFKEFSERIKQEILIRQEVQKPGTLTGWWASLGRDLRHLILKRLFNEESQQYLSVPWSSFSHTEKMGLIVESKQVIRLLKNGPV